MARAHPGDNLSWGPINAVNRVSLQRQRAFAPTQSPPSGWLCNDRIIFFTKIEVDAGATDTDQTLFIEYKFDAHNNGQQGVGYSDILAAGISAVNFPPPSQTGESGNIGLDGTETATLVSEAFAPAGTTFGHPGCG